MSEMIYQVVKKNGSSFFLEFNNDYIAMKWIFEQRIGNIKMIKNVTKNKILYYDRNRIF
jgi:hypothetical protein